MCIYLLNKTMPQGMIIVPLPKSHKIPNQNPKVRHGKSPSSCWSGPSKRVQTNIGNCYFSFVPQNLELSPYCQRHHILWTQYLDGSSFNCPGSLLSDVYPIQAFKGEK